MTLKNKKILLISVIALLTLVNTSAIVTMIYYKNHNHKDVRYRNAKKKNSNYHHRKMCMFVQKKLELNDEQAEQYSKLKNANFKNVEQYTNKIKCYKELIIKELTKQTDTLVLAQFADSIAQQHKLIQLEMNKHFLDIKSILNDDQIVKFQKLLKKMQRHGNYHRKNRRKNKCKQ